ncbi:MAG: hypothetical protein H8E41_05430 [Desulfobulbaceae bacterium]|uniref:DUF3311 domain-containing protein n=1 Tax=Candidatus Desulfobia pelagia TaxID=2841692 RepID=A0A8J6NAG7_9BACT|nr:hypothetical protein [Candidatus Desulfobia pelagia]
MPEVKRRQNERLIVILIIGVIALNYPLLSLFSKVKLIFGIPVLYFYLFTVWTVFIGCVALVLEKTTSSPLIIPSPKPEKAE